MAGDVTLLPASDEAPLLARRFVRAELEGWGVPSANENAVLLASELVTHIVRSGPARSKLRVEIRRDVVRIEVCANTSDAGAPLGADASDVALGIIESLSSKWGVEGEDGITTTWFELEPGERQP